MVETITPAVHGHARRRYRLSVALHAAAAGAAAGALGLVLGAAGALLRASWGAAGLAAVGVVAALYALRALVGLPVPVPARRRQVPAWWRTFFSPAVAAPLYGAALGVGFATFVRDGTFVAVAAASLASGLTGVVLCAPFGLARGCRCSWPGARRAGPDARWIGSRRSRSRLPGALNGASLAAVAVGAFGAALRS